MLVSRYLQVYPQAFTLGHAKCESQYILTTKCMRIKILDLLMGKMYNSVECRSGQIFLMWGHKRNKNAVSLVFSIISKFLKYGKKYNLQSQRLYINCAYTGRGCKLISVSTHMDYLFSTGNVNVFFPALCRFHHFICELIK